jgi:ABC-type nitrate/sulfonate/bicarbonate transport system permease component
MLKNKTHRLLSILRRRQGLVAGLLLLIVWHLVSKFGFIGSTLLATPSEVWAVLIRSLLGRTKHGANVFHHAYWTAERALIGCAISVLIGSVIGGLLGGVRVLYRTFEPIVEFARAIPPVMAFPLLLVAFNFGEPAYIWTIVYGGAPVVIITVAQGVHAIPRPRLEMLKINEVSRGVWALVMFMEILPACVLGARLAFSFSLIIAVVTEMVFTPRNGYGLGSVAKDAEIAFETPEFYCLVIVVGILGYVANVVIKELERTMAGNSRRELTDF